MTLPKIEYPIFTTTIPTTKKQVKIRPMLQKDEKILLIAKEGEDTTEILNAIKQVVTNCLIDKLNVDDLALVDIESLFIKLRSISISNITKVAYVDGEDKETREFDVDLEKVSVKWSEKVENKIPVNDSVTLELRYPRAALYSDKEFLQSSGEEAIQRLLISTLDKIITGGTTIDATKEKRDDIMKFIGDLPISVYNKLREYVANLPHLHYEISYKNSLGHDRKIVLAALNDFFTLV